MMIAKSSVARPEKTITKKEIGLDVPDQRDRKGPERFDSLLTEMWQQIKKGYQ